MRPDLVVVFARAPEPGRVKTRLAASIGDERACALYRKVGARVIDGLLLDDARGYDLRVSYTPRGAEDALRAWVGGADAYVPQVDGGLGARLAHEARCAFDEGYRAVLLVGTDCVAVTDARVREALRALDGHDAVLGPAHDGGYYLLGLRRALPVFDDVPWSTEAVADVTRALLSRSGASWAELPVERDLDTVEDLEALGGEALLLGDDRGDHPGEEPPWTR